MKPSYRRSWAGNLLMFSDLTLGPSFKVIRWFTGFGELSFRWIQISISFPMRRSSFFAFILYFWLNAVTLDCYQIEWVVFHVRLSCIVIKWIIIRLNVTVDVNVVFIQGWLVIGVFHTGCFRVNSLSGLVILNSHSSLYVHILKCILFDILFHTLGDTFYRIQ